MPINRASTQHKLSRNKVNERGGPEFVDEAVGVPVTMEEVGATNGVDVTANGAPETGTMVGTKVGVGWAVG